jgi:hypothetical protein
MSARSRDVAQPRPRAERTACHAAAAPRWATRRDTEAPTPNEIDQMSASRQRTPRAAGFSGGSWSRFTRQRAVIPLRHAAAAAAPEANANISHRGRCTRNHSPASTSGNPDNDGDPGRRGWKGRSRCVPRGPSKWGANRLPDVGEPTDRVSLLIPRSAWDARVTKLCSGYAGIDGLGDRPRG